MLESWTLFLVKENGLKGKNSDQFLIHPRNYRKVSVLCFWWLILKIRNSGFHSSKSHLQGYN